MLTFNADKHEYRYDGKIVPGVTEILGDFIVTDIGYHVHRHTGKAIPSAKMEEAAAKGQDIHRCCQYINQGGLDWDALDPLYLKPAREYERWLDLYKPEILYSEAMLYSKRYNYAGTCDIIAMMQHLSIPRRGKVLTFVDIKTGLSSSVGPQTAAYEQGWCEEHGYTGPTQRAVLWLPKNGGKHKFEMLTNKRDFDYFKACLFIHRFKG